MTAATTPPNETRSTCPYCGVGCGVIIESQAGQITGVRGDPDHPANFGRLCTKGSTLHLTATRTIAMHTRLLQPQLRPQRDAPRAVVDWNTALDTAAERFADIVRTHSPERNPLDLPLLRRRLRRDHRIASGGRSPACAATRITPQTSGACAPRAARCT